LEYLLNKWLTNNNLYTNVNQFTIHNEINLVSTLGETNYNEQITKGILMPIQFQFKSFFEYDNNLNKTLKVQSNRTRAARAVARTTDLRGLRCLTTRGQSRG